VRRVSDTTEPKLMGGTIFSIPILIQTPPFPPRDCGTYRPLNGVELFAFLKPKGLSNIPNLYWSQLTHMPNKADHTVGWQFCLDSVSVATMGEDGNLGEEKDFRKELEKIYKV
jgi:hypothetical protein